MDKKIEEYRNKHKRCKWCKYYKHIIRENGIQFYSFDKCILKEKIINYPILAKVCKYYELKEEKW